MYEPKSRKLIIVKSRLSPASWEARVQRAREAEGAMLRIVRRVDSGEPIDAVIAQEVPKSRRSWVYHHWRGYKAEGFESLIDRRVSREPKLAQACVPLIEAAREANPSITVEGVLAILDRQKMAPLPSESTIEKCFARVDARSRYREKKQREATGRSEPLTYAGGELLVAAELETQAVSTLTDTVVEIANAAKELAKDAVPERDQAYRDDHGRFTPEYNERRRRREGESVADYLKTADEKAEGRVPTWPRFVQERRETLDAKMRMLTFGPLVGGTQGWDSLRTASAADLEPLTGFAYMPSTLAKFCSALAISGAGPLLLEAVGRNWHAVAQARWGEGGAMSALYIDNHCKEVWSSLFTLSGKVASLNRVMPCITTTYAHTGPGVPVVLSVQSGSAPLAPRLIDLVKQAEATLETEVQRAVIIDSEGSTFDILDTFAREGRVIVTPLKPSRTPELELSYSPGSYFRPYREHDRLRVARAKLLHKSTGRELSLGALIIQRQEREHETILLTTGLNLGMGGRDLADLYFARWPVQEGAFRDGGVVGLDRHRGNSSRIVSNIAVVTALDRLERRTQDQSSKREGLFEDQEQLEAELGHAEGELRGAQTGLAGRRQELDALVTAAGEPDGPALARVVVEYQQALARDELATERCDAARHKLETVYHRAERLDVEAEQIAARKLKLEPRREIREVDVALDMILTATKLTAALLIAFVLREYLAGSQLSPQTFLSRVFNLRGRREIAGHEERIVFYENPRDPRINEAMAGACQRLNSRGLTREGRSLVYAIEEEEERPSRI